MTLTKMFDQFKRLVPKISTINSQRNFEKYLQFQRKYNVILQQIY